MKELQTQKDIDEYIAEMKQFAESLTKEQAKEFLYKIGIYTKTGRLTKNYR